MLFSLFIGAQCSWGQNFTERPEYIKANSNWIHDGYPISGGGDLYRYDFNTSPPTLNPITITSPRPNAQVSSRFYEGRTSISDTATGDLLFFTNGERCFNRNYEMMSNGDSLRGSISANQGCLIVPVIDSPGKFYLFTLGSADEINQPLHYSIIDMSLDGGMGDIVPGRKNILVDAGPFQESMMGVPGNNCDVWLVTHPMTDTSFKAYHITREGIDTTPVVSAPGNMISGGVYTFEGGGMSISPDRSLLAIGSYSYQCPVIGWQPALGGLMLTKFDPETGVVSDGILINDSMASYNSCFSPDGNKLYVHGAVEDSAGSNTFSCRILQYDISNYTHSAITASEYLVSENSNVFNGIITNLRRWNDTIIISYDLKYIASPNLSGAACNLQNSSYLPSLSLVNSGTLGLEAIYPLPPDTIYRMAVDTTICEYDQLLLEGPSSYTDYQWNNNDTNDKQTVTAPGTYWVAYNDGCHFGVDTFKITTVR